MDEDFEEIQEEYIQTLLDDIEDIEKLILGLEETPTDKAILKKFVMRLHSIKGSSGSYGMSFISSLCHSLEGTIELDKNTGLNSEKIQAYFKYIDLLNDYTKNFKIIDDEKLKEFKDTLRKLQTHGKIDPLDILYVDNKGPLVKTLMKQLNTSDFKVTFSFDGHEALGLLMKKNHFDCLITGKHISNIGGIQLIKMNNILQNNRQMKTILFTTDDNLPEEDKALLDHILLKTPSSFSEMKDILINIRAQKQPQKVSQQAPPATAVNLNATTFPEKILYIDDDLTLHTLFKFAMKSAPESQVKYSQSAAEGLEEISNFDPQLIVVDYNMPEMSGIELCKKVISDYGPDKYPIIFLTGLNKDEEHQEMLSAGAKGVLQKPFNVKGLKEDLSLIWNKIHKA